MNFIGGTAAVAAALLVLAGCGGTSGSSGDAKAAAAASASASKAAEQAAQARQRAAAKRKAQQTAVYKECKVVAGPLDDDLTDLGSRLSVGLNFQKYSDAVGDAKVDYDKLIRDAKARGGISDQCIAKVGTPLESGLNAYIAAYNTWNDCVNDTYCTFDKGTGPVKKVQAKWAKAGTYVDRADSALARMEP